MVVAVVEEDEEATTGEGTTVTTTDIDLPLARRQLPATCLLPSGFLSLHLHCLSSQSDCTVAGDMTMFACTHFHHHLLCQGLSHPIHVEVAVPSISHFRACF